MAAAGRSSLCQPLRVKDLVRATARDSISDVPLKRTNIRGDWWSRAANALTRAAYVQCAGLELHARGGIIQSIHEMCVQNL